MTPPLLHACSMCGGSCQGMVVRLLADLGEPEAITRYASGFGLTDPIVNGALRRQHGDCCFLDDQHRCRIHTRHGLEAKPLVCQTFPLVVLRTQDQQRVGIDPGCFTDIRTWRDGPEAEITGMLVRRTPLAQVEAEAALVELLRRPGLTLAEALSQVTHPGISARWVARIQEQRPRLDALAGSTGSTIRSLWPAFQQTIDRLDPGEPRPLLGPNEDAYAIDVARRMVELRLATQIPTVLGVAVLTLLGALLCGWIDPERDAFGSHLAAWTRLIRAPPFLAALIPDAQTFEWLIRG